MIGAWGGIGEIGVGLARMSLFVLVGSVIAGGGRGWDRPLVVTGLTAVGLGLAVFLAPIGGIWRPDPATVPWILMYPQREFSRAIRTTKATSTSPIAGLPVRWG